MGRFLANSQIVGQQSDNLVKFYYAILSCSSVEQLGERIAGDLELKNFTGILAKDDKETIPSFWSEVFKLDEPIKQAFVIVAIALFSDLLSERTRAKKLVFYYDSIDNRKPTDFLENVFLRKYDDSYSFVGRSARSIERLFSACSLSKPTPNKEEFSYQCDCSDLLNYPSIGVLVKQYIQRIMLMEGIPESRVFDNEFFNRMCERNRIDKLMGLSHKEFCDWLAGQGNYIGRIEIKDFYCIEEAKLDFGDSKEIYLLGANGDGKTLLLDAIYLAFNGNYVNRLKSEDVGAAQDMLKGDISTLSGWDNKGVAYSVQRSVQLKNLFAYGVHRGRYDSMTANAAEKYGFMTLFSINKTLINPSEWIEKVCLIELMKSGSQGVIQFGIGQQTTERMKQLQEIFDVVLDRKVIVYYDLVENCIMYEEEGAKLKFDVLSEGYRSTIIFMCDLLHRLYQSNPDSIFDQRDVAGVVLVDEIDAHLHPKWQREIVGHLRKLFPQIQFIFTTHSPYIIQGAGNEALIYRVYRENGKTCTSEPYHRNRLNRMMINTLSTSPIFGLDNARLDPNDDNADTSDSYLISRIEQLVREDISKQGPRKYITPAMIDEMIKRAKERAKSNS